MSTPAISGLTQSTSALTKAKPRASKSDLNFDDFVNLLATELQYQDPSNPVSSTEYVAQVAQLSSLNQLESIDSSLNNAQAYSMIGKDVTYKTTDSLGNSTQSTGTVDKVIRSGKKTYLSVNGTNVELNSVVSVAAGSTGSSAGKPAGSSANNLATA